MKMLFTTLLVSVSFWGGFFNQHVYAQSGKKEVSQHKLLGNFIYLNKTDKRNDLGYEYYLKIDTKKGQLAYPVKFSDEKLKNFVRQNMSKQFLVKAVPTNENVFVGISETRTTVMVMNVIQAKPIDLASIGYKGGLEAEVQPQMKGETQSGRPSISGINDTVTNSIIFSAGAALLGSMLLSK